MKGRKRAMGIVGKQMAKAEWLRELRRGRQGTAGPSVAITNHFRLLAVSS